MLLTLPVIFLRAQQLPIVCCFVLYNLNVREQHIGISGNNAVLAILRWVSRPAVDRSIFCSNGILCTTMYKHH